MVRYILLILSLIFMIKCQKAEPLKKFRVTSLFGATSVNQNDFNYSVDKKLLFEIGDTLTTGKNSVINFKYKKSKFRLLARSILEIRTRVEPNKTLHYNLILKKGKLMGLLNKNSSKDSFYIETKALLSEVNRTKFIIKVTKTGFTRLGIIKGLANISRNLTTIGLASPKLIGSSFIINGIQNDLDFGVEIKKYQAASASGRYTVAYSHKLEYMIEAGDRRLKRPKAKPSKIDKAIRKVSSRGKGKKYNYGKMTKIKTGDIYKIGFSKKEVKQLKRLSKRFTITKHIRKKL